MALPVGPEVTPVATNTMEAAPLHYNLDAGEDCGEVSVGGPSSAVQPLPTASVDLTVVPPAPATSAQDHTEDVLTLLSPPPANASLSAIVASQSPLSRTGDFPGSLPSATVAVPTYPSRRVTSPIFQGPL